MHKMVDNLIGRQIRNPNNEPIEKFCDALSDWITAKAKVAKGKSEAFVFFATFAPAVNDFRFQFRA